MQARGLVERDECPSDARGAFAVLGACGLAEIERAAPVHVASVRRHLIDVLDAEQLEPAGRHRGAGRRAPARRERLPGGDGDGRADRRPAARGSCGLTAASLRAVTATETTPAKERWRAQWAELFTEVVTSGLCTGCAGCVVACPHDVLGYDDTERGLPALPPGGRAGPRRLRPRAAGVHQLHPGLPPLPQLGDRDRHLPVRAGARARRAGRRQQGHLPGPGHRPGAARAGPGRRSGLGHPAVVPGARPHRRRPGVDARR